MANLRMILLICQMATVSFAGWYKGVRQGQKFIFSNAFSPANSRIKLYFKEILIAQKEPNRTPMITAKHEMDLAIQNGQLVIRHMSPSFEGCYDRLVDNLKDPFVCLKILKDPAVITSTYEERILGKYTRKVWIVTRSMECNAPIISLCSRRTAEDECENRPALIEKMSGSCKVKITLNETFNNIGYYVKFNQFRNAHDRVGFYKLETKQDPAVIDSTYEEKMLGKYTRKVWIVTLSKECSAQKITVCSRRTADDECENRPALIEKMSGSCKVKITLNETRSNTGYYVHFDQFRNANDSVGFYFELETKQDPVVVNSKYEEKILGNYTRKVWIVTRSMECNAETITLCSRRKGECENRPALIEKMSGSCKVKITLNETFNTTGYYIKFNQFRNVHDRVGFYKLETKQEQVITGEQSYNLKQRTTHRPNVAHSRFLLRSITNTEVTESTETSSNGGTVAMSTVLEIITRGPSKHPSKNSDRRSTLSTNLIIFIAAVSVIILAILLPLRLCCTRHRVQFNRVELRHF